MMQFIENNWLVWLIFSLGMIGGWAYMKWKQHQQVQAQCVVVGTLGCLYICYQIATIIGVIFAGISLIMRFFFHR